METNFLIFSPSLSSGEPMGQSGQGYAFRLSSILGGALGAVHKDTLCLEEPS